MVKIPVRTWDFPRCFPSPLDSQATCWPDSSLSIFSFTSRPEPQQKAPSAPPPPPPPPPPPLPEPTPPEPEEEILGSDDEEQEDPADYCKGGCSPVLTAGVMGIMHIFHPILREVFKDLVIVYGTYTEVVKNCLHNCLQLNFFTSHSFCMHFASKRYVRYYMSVLVIRINFSWLISIVRETNILTKICLYYSNTLCILKYLNAFDIN